MEGMAWTRMQSKRSYSLVSYLEWAIQPKKYDKSEKKEYPKDRNDR